VTLKLKRAGVMAAGGLVMFVALAEWLIWLMPPPHGRLQYMVAGTAATTAALGMAFALVVRVREELKRRVRDLGTDYDCS
jgi:hypothetical protein